MRTAAILMLMTLTALVAGCGRAERGEQRAAPANDGTEEVWEVFKVEVPGHTGGRTELLAGVEVQVKNNTLTLSQSGMFSHTYHAGALGIDCRHCHKVGKPSSAANVTVITCWTCHQKLAPATAEVNVTPENYATVAAQVRRQQRYLVKLDENVSPAQADFIEYPEQDTPDVATSPTYRAIFKNEGDTRIVALSLEAHAPRPKVFTPSLLKSGLGTIVVLHMRKK